MQTDRQEDGQTDGQTDRHDKNNILFRNFAKVSKNRLFKGYFQHILRTRLYHIHPIS